MTIANNPYWYKLISYWVKVRNRNGLTIPFIIGAKQFSNLNHDNVSLTVHELFTEIANSEMSDTVTLFYCDYIGDYVLGFRSSQNSMSGIEVKNEQTNKTTLVATLSTQILGNNIKDITKALAERYSNCLANKKYSLIMSKWTDYSEGDLKMINEALTSNEFIK